MHNIGIFFGSDTGNTEKIANKIYKIVKKHNKTQIFNISNTKKEDMEKFEILLLGIPTWYYGEAQCDWEDFFPTLDTIDFSKKIIAIFGCGDQEDYSEYFCDAMGILKTRLKNTCNNFIGKWPTKEYYFESSKGLEDNNNFVGLTIDEDRQPELTDKRIVEWTDKLLKEINIQKSS